MSLQNIKAGGAFIEITAKDRTASGLKSAMGKAKAFAAGMQSIGASLAGVGAAVAGLGSAIVAPLAGAAKMFADTGSAVADMSARTGLAADHLSELAYAAEMGGASASELEAALVRMGKNGLDPAQFDQVAASIASISDPAERIAAAYQAWGKAGVKLLPMLDSLQALRGEARGLGLTIDPKTAQKADALGDSLDRLRKVGSDLAFELGSAIAEPLTAFADAATKVISTVAGWIQQNQQLVVGIAAIGAAAITAGGVIAGLGVAILGAGVVLSGIVSTVTALGVGGTLTAVAGGIAAIVGSVAGLAFSWSKVSKEASKALEGTKIFLGGIAKAIGSGSLENAWEQAATGIGIVWATVMNGVVQAAVEAMNETIRIVGEAVRKLGLLTTGFGIYLNFKTGRDGGLREFGEAIGGLAGGLASISQSLTEASRSSGIKAIEEMQAKLRELRREAELLSSGSPLVQIDNSKAAVRTVILDEALRTIQAVKPESLMGGAMGTFNASAASLLGQAGGPMDRTAKETQKQTGILEKIKELLGDIDDGIEDLEGFSFQ